MAYHGRAEPGPKQAPCDGAASDRPVMPFWLSLGSTASAYGLGVMSACWGAAAGIGAAPRNVGQHRYRYILGQSGWLYRNDGIVVTWCPLITVSGCATAIAWSPGGPVLQAAATRDRGMRRASGVVFHSRPSMGVLRCRSIVHRSGDTRPFYRQHLERIHRRRTKGSSWRPWHTRYWMVSVPAVDGDRCTRCRGYAPLGPRLARDWDQRQGEQRVDTGAHPAACGRSRRENSCARVE